MTPTDANPDYLPRDTDPSLLCHRDLVERVERLEAELATADTTDRMVGSTIEAVFPDGTYRIKSKFGQVSRSSFYRNGSEVVLTEKMEEITKLARKHNNPSVNIGAHALAGKILKILEGEQ